MAALTGYRAPGDLKWDGADISAVLATHAALPARPLYTVGPNWRARSLRLGDWKLVVTGKDAKAKTELFQLAADPGETTNLATREPARLRLMEERLNAMAARDLDAVAKD